MGGVERAHRSAEAVQPERQSAAEGNCGRGDRLEYHTHRGDHESARVHTENSAAVRAGVHLRHHVSRRAAVPVQARI